MTHRIAIILCLLLALPHLAFGQKEYTWQQFVNEYTASLSEDEIDEDRLQEELENLENLHHTPYNLNLVTQEELQKIPLVEAAQVEDIIAYRDKHFPLFGMGELSLIASLTYQTRQILSLFLICEPVKVKQSSIWKQLIEGNHELTLRFDVPLYTRDGFKNNSQLSTSQKYLGDKYYTSLRYRYNNQDTIKYGLTAEKDAGEPFASRGNTLYDAYSFYFYLNPRNGNYTLSLGDFRIHMGEGLIAGNGFMVGRTSYLSTTVYRQGSIKPHTGISESDYFRGVAGAYQWKHFTVTAFGAYTPKDAILRGDSVISSLKTDGYHRTQTEQSRRHNIYNLTMGAEINWNFNLIDFGISGLATHYDHKMQPADREYNKYAMRGSNFQAGSIHYYLHARRITSQGEAALSDNGAAAFLNTIRYTPLNNIRLVSVQRYYGIKYHSPFGYAFKAGSRLQNERGIYTGANIDLSYKWNVKGYADFFFFPWATYKYPSSSHGQAYMAEANYRPKRKNMLTAQYQYRTNQYRENGKAQHSSRHQLRLSGTFDLQPFTLQTNVRTSLVKETGQSNSKGWLASQRIAYNRESCHITALLAYFDTDNYSSHIYLYTPNVVYANSSQSFYGHGIYAAIVGRILAFRRVEISGRYGIIHYFDASSIGSGAQRINSSSKQDVILQMRYRF